MRSARDTSRTRPQIRIIVPVNLCDVRSEFGVDQIGGCARVDEEKVAGTVIHGSQQHEVGAEAKDPRKTGGKRWRILQALAGGWPIRERLKQQFQMGKI